MGKNVTIYLFLLFLLIIATTSYAYFGWEDGTTQGWKGDDISNSKTFNATKYYYSGRHSLGIDLNLSGDGFKSAKVILPFYEVKKEIGLSSQLAFKVFIPSFPVIPLDLKIQMYMEDSQGKINRNNWSFLLIDRWNDIIIDIPDDFQEPFSIALIFGTNFQYIGTVYIDQMELPTISDLSKGCYTNNVLESFYNTYVPNFSESPKLQLIPNEEVILDIPIQTGGFGVPVSEEENNSNVILEHETLLFLSIGLCFLGLIFKHIKQYNQ